MQTPPLPNKIDPWRLTAEGGQLQGALALASLPRLAAALERAEGVVSVCLTAGVDAQGIRFISGQLKTELILVCQRCLGTLRWPLDIAVNLGLARNEIMTDRLPEHYEPLLIAEGVIGVADLVEDEVLLALPQFPRHDNVRECEANVDQALSASQPVPHTGQGQPFARLASLLRDDKRSH